MTSSPPPPESSQGSSRELKRGLRRELSQSQREPSREPSPDSPWPAWQRRETLLAAVFRDEQVRRLAEVRRSVQLSRATLVYSVYENPFARSGGIFSVTSYLPAALAAHMAHVVVLSPLHRRLKTAPALGSLKSVGRTGVCFGGRSIELELFEHIERQTRWILMSAETFFEAEGGPSQTDPYVHNDPSRLLRDALFAANAIPRALAALGLTRDLVVHVQDWELAAAALTVKQALLDGLLESAAVVLTSHNPYDCDVPPHALALISEWTAPEAWPPAVDDRPSAAPLTGARSTLARNSMYERMIPLMDAPVAAVSRTFAVELVSDPLQTSLFAGHLQGVLRYQGVVGIDNGLFGDARPPFSDLAVAAAAAGQPQRILEEKASRRARLLEVLESYRDPRMLGRLAAAGNRPLTELAPDVPIYMMFGRMDPGQKGFDLLARAIEMLPPGAARFVLTPIVGNDVDAFRDDLEQLAAARAGDVVVYPFRMERGYLEAMAGSTFVVMPSLYEPFGAATEAYLAGTPVVARSTGGLVQQVIDFESDPDHATGLRYREMIPAWVKPDDDWRKIQERRHPVARMSIPLYGAQVQALAAALTRAGSLYRDGVVYGRMLANLFPQVQRFSWQRAAAECRALYELAVGP